MGKIAIRDGILYKSGKLEDNEFEEMKHHAVVGAEIYTYLKDNDGLKYFEMLNENVWNDLERDEFLEVLVTARFSKIKEIANAAKEIESFAQLVELFSDQPLLDKKTKDAIGGIKGIESFKKGKGNNLPVFIS